MHAKFGHAKFGHDASATKKAEVRSQWLEDICRPPPPLIVKIKQPDLFLFLPKFCLLHLRDHTIPLYLSSYVLSSFHPTVNSRNSLTLTIDLVILKKKILLYLHFILLNFVITMSTTMRLTEQRDWVNWHAEFQRVAANYGVWEKVTSSADASPFLTKPVAPVFEEAITEWLTLYSSTPTARQTPSLPPA